eukprot:6471189-Amphidinium_carterae.1
MTRTDLREPVHIKKKIEKAPPRHLGPPPCQQKGVPDCLQSKIEGGAGRAFPTLPCTIKPLLPSGQLLQVPFGLPEWVCPPPLLDHPWPPPTDTGALRTITVASQVPKELAI